MFPVLAIGLLFEDRIDTLFNNNVPLVASALILTGILLWSTTKASEQKGRIYFLENRFW